VSTFDWEKHWGDLVSYLDGDLDTEAAADVERLLDSSPECRSALKWLEHTRDDLQAIGATLTANAPQVHLVDNILDAVAWGELVDHAEGDSSPDDAARIEGLMAASEALRADHIWLKETIADFQAVGDAIAAEAPAVALADDVLAAVRRSDTPPAKTVSLDAYRRRTRRVWFAAAMAAAGLLVAALAWLLGPSEPAGDGRDLPLIANEDTPEGPAHPEDVAPIPRSPEFGPVKLKLDEQKEKLEKVLMARQTDAAFEATAPPDIASVTLDAVIAARRDAAGNPALWGRLKQLASLTPADVGRIMAIPDLSAAAMVGVAGAATPEQSQALLMTAVGHYPEDPYVRLELVQATSETQQAAGEAPAPLEPAALDAARGQLDILKQLDPDNALAYYLEARLLFDAGNPEAALAALAAAQAFDGASAYALESANYRIEALIAGGMAPEAARLVSALTGGVDQYTFLHDLGGDLLEYGQHCFEAGDFASAEQIFGAVHELGAQLDGNADFAQEQLAALDIQDAAIGALEVLYAALESTEGLEELTAQTVALFEGFQQIGDIIVALDSLFFGEASTDFWTRVSDVVLGQGDWNLLGYLEELGSLTVPPSEGDQPAGQGSL
jgi:anti-sigma factor RsiW